MRIRHRSIVILASRGITQVSTIVLAAILVRIISQELFGTYRQVMLVYMFIGGLINLQIESSLYYFIPRMEASRRRQILSQALTATLLVSVVGAMGMHLAAGWVSHLFKNPDLGPLLSIFALYFFPDRLLVLVPAFMISLDRAPRAGVYTLAMALARMGAAAAALGLGCSLATALWAMIAVAVILALVGVADMARLTRGGSWRYERYLFVELFHYAWPLWGTAVVAVVNLQLGNALISGFFDPATFAVYACGAMELPVVALITSSMTSAVMPNLVTLCSEGRRDSALSLWHEAARKSSLIIFPCFAFCLVVAGSIMIFLYGPDYAKAAWPFAVYLFALPLRVAVYSALLRALNRTSRIMGGAVIALAVNLVVSLGLLMLLRGTPGAFVAPAIGTVAAQVVSTVYLLYQIVRIMGIRWSDVMQWRELAGILVVSLACGGVTWGVGSVMPDMPVVWRLLGLGGVFTAAFGSALFLLRMLRPDEVAMVTLPLRIVRSGLAKRSIT